MENFILPLGVGFVSGTVWGSLFEWTFHRYVMHRRAPLLTYSFKRHTLTHHHVFKADDTYHVQRSEDQATVPMAWWNGPALIAVAQIPFVIWVLLGGSMGILCGAFAAIVLYYIGYEYLHWCMHIPKARRVERSGLFFRLNGHHLLHHRYMNRNFNVVVPLADLIFGTLLLRSKVSFAQARGPSVPDVQPPPRTPRAAATATTEQTY